MRVPKSHKGVSLAAIVKNIAAKLGTQAAHWRRYVYVKKFVRHALQTGKLVNVKGKGLTGSFKPANMVKAKPNKRAKPTAAAKPVNKLRSSQKQKRTRN